MENKLNLKEENVNDIVPVLDILKINSKEVVSKIKEEVKEGNIDAVQAYIALRKMEKVVKKALDSKEGDKELKQIFRQAVEVSLDGGKSVTTFGCELAIRDTGVRYDYKDCKDSVLNELYKIKIEVDAQIKKREDEIRTALPADAKITQLGIRSKKVIQEGIPTLEWSEDEFEETIFPPIRYAGSSIYATFKEK